MSGEDLQPGSIVADQYEIERLIGSGGFARIYRARQLELDRPVALKVLAPRDDNETSASSETVKKRFYREARLVSQLQAPHTVTVYEYDVLEDGKLYMALEYIDGTDLNTLISQQAPLAPERIVRILVQVLKGLGAAHSREILHRDVKPTNVMVFDRFGETDCVKLLDFGIAKSVMTENHLEGGLTMEGAVVGTPKYMSPEQLQGRPLTPASDLFSVGLLVYEMYAGESPFETHDVTAIFRRIQRMPEDLGPLEEAPEPLGTVARTLLTPDLEDRYGAAGDVLGDLVGTETGTSASTAAPAALEATGSTAESPETRARRTESAGEDEPISFPLGLDRAGQTPSTELTSVAAGGYTTLALSPAAEGTSASPPEQRMRGRRSPSNARRAGDVPTDDPSDSTPPTGEVETSPGTSPPDLPTASELDLPKWFEDVWWRAIALAALVAAGLLVGIWYSSGPDADEGAIDSADPETTAPSPSTDDSESAIDSRETRERAAEQLESALDRATRRAESAAEESADAPGSEDRKSPPRREPNPERRVPTDDSRDRTGDESDRPDRTDETSEEDSRDPGFEVKPLE